MSTIMVDTIGMTGTALVLAAYGLLQLERLDMKGLVYNMMNLVGAILVLISLCYKFNLASFVIEIFWVGISSVGLYKSYKKRR